VLVHQFFPAFSPTAGTLAAFAVGFAARSLGRAASRVYPMIFAAVRPRLTLPGPSRHHQAVGNALPVADRATVIGAVLDLEVGIDPTTYRLQDGRSARSVVTTSTNSYGPVPMSTTVPLR
jgi:hypothetical protein